MTVRPVEITHPKHCACRACRMCREITQTRRAMRLAWMLILLAVILLMVSCRYAQRMDMAALGRDVERIAEPIAEVGFNKHLDRN